MGRFLQADPFIQAPYNTQSLNRYSYVLNNPLNATDPSGYFWNLVAQAFVAYLITDLVVTIGINSGWSSDLIAAVTLAVSFWVGGMDFGTSSLTQAQQVAVVATLGGITSMLQGGKFGHGFVSAGLSRYGGNKIGDSPTMNGVTRTLARLTLGGTISKITGGKFANGAVGAAFAMMVQSVRAGIGATQIEGSGNESSIKKLENLPEDPEKVFNKGLSEARKQAGLTLNNVDINFVKDRHLLIKCLDSDCSSYTARTELSVDAAIAFLKDNSDWGIVDGTYSNGRVKIYPSATALTHFNFPKGNIPYMRALSRLPGSSYSTQITGIENVIQTLSHETGHHVSLGHDNHMRTREWKSIQFYRGN